MEYNIFSEKVKWDTEKIYSSHVARKACRLCVSKYNGTINACASKLLFNIPPPFAPSSLKLSVNFFFSLFLWKLTTFPRRTTYDTDRIPILTVFPGNSSLSSPVSTVKMERWWRRKKQFGRSERVTFWIYSYCFFLAFPLTDTFSLLSLHFLLLNCISVWIITWNYSAGAGGARPNQVTLKSKANISPSSKTLEET